MEIIVGENAGFCNGVEYTIKKANELLDKGEIYCLGEIIHNKNVGCYKGLLLAYLTL